jgi:hypothetical protein
VHLLDPADVVEVVVGDEDRIHIGHRDPQRLHIAQQRRGMLLPHVAAHVEKDPLLIGGDQIGDARLGGQVLCARVVLHQREDGEMRDGPEVLQSMGAYLLPFAISLFPLAQERRGRERPGHTGHGPVDGIALLPGECSSGHDLPPDRR